MAFPLLAMAAPAIISGVAGIFGAKKQAKSNERMAAAMRTNLAGRTVSGTGGLQGWAGDDSTGFDLGQLASSFDNQQGFADITSGMAMDSLYGGVPAAVQQADWNLSQQPLDLGSFMSGQQGGNALAMRSLADAFGGGFNPNTIATDALGKLRAQAAPQEQQQMQDFMQNLYSSGRGAVTGAAGNEASMGGGRLAAAFGQGLSRADIDRQIAAQEYGINAANASENLLKSAFGRFMDSSQFAADMNANAFNRQRGVLQQGYDRSIQQMGIPAQLAAAFQNLSTSGVGQAIDLQNLGLAAQTNALQVAKGSADARIGAGGNVASYMSNRSASPVADAVGSIFGGMATPQSGQAAMDMFRNIFNRGTPKPTGILDSSGHAIPGLG